MKRWDICIVHKRYDFNICDSRLWAKVMKQKKVPKKNKLKRAKTLDMYPIKNLEDLYDKEGYRDGEFKKGDKGTWTLLTSFAKSNKPGEIDDEGMVLFLNRNTKKATGYYYMNKSS